MHQVFKVNQQFAVIAFRSAQIVVECMISDLNTWVITNNTVVITDQLRLKILFHLENMLSILKFKFSLIFIFFMHFFLFLSLLVNWWILRFLKKILLEKLWLLRHIILENNLCLLSVPQSSTNCMNPVLDKDNAKLGVYSSAVTDKPVIK